MKREDLLKEMKDSVGNKDPIVFFDKMTDALNLLFDRIDILKISVDKLKTQTALAINWDAKIAADIIANEVKALQAIDKVLYENEIAMLRVAYATDTVTQSYKEFCEFWQNTLGYHPFLE